MQVSRFLLIQTAFIGDAILATALLEKLADFYPHATIDLLIRRGNESLFDQHPRLNKVLIWDKRKKYSSWWELLKEVRRTHYDVVINVQRFASMGLFTACSAANHTVGFHSNPFSFAFSKRVKHSIIEGLHEVERNQKLIEHLTDATAARPVLYPTADQLAQVAEYKLLPYICIAPASVWFTKQLPEQVWAAFISELPPRLHIYLLGAKNDHPLCERLREVEPGHTTNLAGTIGLLASAALMKDAVMCFTNDSAPMHLASAVNAPNCAVFCSTIPDFGFGPLSETQEVVQSSLELRCKPCGLHGHKHCPESHFLCGTSVASHQLVNALRKVYPSTEVD